jgi:glutaredoxin
MAVLFNVFGKDNCPYCVKTVALLSKTGMSYVYTKIGEGITIEEFKKLFPSAKTVPQIQVLKDGVTHYVGGYNQLEEYLSW